MADRFSTANPGAVDASAIASVRSFPNGEITWLFEATVDATEEAIANALVGGRTMTGIDGVTAPRLPLERTREILRRHRRRVGPR